MSKHGTSGYGNPPVASQFKKGRSGNPKGRPKKQGRRDILSAVLNQPVDLSKGGKTQKVSAEEALTLSMLKNALDGDFRSRRDLLDRAEKRRVTEKHEPITVIKRIIVNPKECNVPLERLGIVRNIDGQWRIEPSVIEWAVTQHPGLVLSTADKALISNSAVDRATCRQVLESSDP